MRRALAAAATVLVVLTGATACGGDDTSTVSSIDITVKDGTITPNGEEVHIKVGEPITLDVTADAPGEIHVHSDPEQEFEYEGTGDVETFELTIERPGQIEVESHTLDQQIVKLVAE